LIGIVIRIYYKSAESPELCRMNPQDCFTHNSFDHTLLPLLLALRILSLCLPLLGIPEASPFSPLVIRNSFCSLFPAADCFRGGDPWYMASSGVRSVRSVATFRDTDGRVVARVNGGNVVFRELGLGAWVGAISRRASSYDMLCCYDVKCGIVSLAIREMFSIFCQGGLLGCRTFTIARG